MLRTRRARLSRAGEETAGMYEYFAATHLHHVGNDDYNGKPFYLEDWQRENFWKPIFGTGRMVRGRFRRKYRRVLIGLPRDFGKTETACAIMLTIANMEPIPNGQYGIIAYSEDMSAKILSTMSAMVKLDPDLDAQWEPLKSEIQNVETGAVIKIFPYKEGAVQSWHFNVVICDEMHVWQGKRVYNALVSGQRSIPNALLIAITTAGGEREGFLWDWIPKMMADPSAYVWWHGANDNDDVDSRKLWEELALPSWVTVDQIEDQRRSLDRPDFERYVLNRFPTEKSEDRSIKQSDIRACLGIDSDFDFDRPFTLAVDGATSGDAFAIVAHQHWGGCDRFCEWVYDEPGERGYYDLNQIEGVIAGIAQKYRCPVGIDPARLLLMAQQLQDDYGVEIYEVRQSNQIMCPACSLLVNAAHSHELALGGCPKLAEHLGNCIDVKREPYGKRFGSTAHGQGTKRIDAAIAAAMAKWMTQTMPQALSFAETGGVWTL